jgi:hypothetical protein
MDVAAQRHGFQVAMIAAGNTVNQDASLGHVHVTEGAKGVRLFLQLVWYILTLYTSSLMSSVEATLMS